MPSAARAAPYKVGCVCRNVHKPHLTSSCSSDTADPPSAKLLKRRRRRGVGWEVLLVRIRLRSVLQRRMKTLPHLPRGQGTPPASHSDTEVEMGPSSIRKGKKLQAEKRRRARINDSLNQIKNIVCGTACPNDPNISKMEKAEILESTLQYLLSQQQHSISSGGQQQQQPQEMSVPDLQGRFRSGFSKCAQMVLEFLQTQLELPLEARKRMAEHLSHRLKALDQSVLPPSGGTPPPLPPASFDRPPAPAVMGPLFRGQGAFPAGMTVAMPFTHASSYVQAPVITSSTPALPPPPGPPVLPMLDLVPTSLREAPPVITSQPLPQPSSCRLQEVPTKCPRPRLQGGNSHRDLKVVVPLEVNSPQREDSFLHIAPADISTSSQEGEEKEEESALPMKDNNRQQVSSPLPLNAGMGMWRPW